MTDIQQDQVPFRFLEELDSEATLKLSRIRQKKLGKKLAGYALVAASLSSFVGMIVMADGELRDAGNEASLPPQQTMESSTTSSTTTTLQREVVPPRSCETPYMEVIKGDTLSEIGRICTIPLNQLIAYNPDLTDPNSIEIGYIIRTARPESTTTLPVETLPPTTVPVETAPPTTMAPVVETPPPTTLPVETLPPTTVPVETAPPVAKNDGVLSAAECAAAGGIKYSFGNNETLFTYLMKKFSFTEAQANAAIRSQRVKDLRLVQIYADDPNDAVDLRECAPKTAQGLE